MKVLVAGTYTVSDAYPNVKYRIKTLKQDRTLEIKEIRFGSSTRLDYSHGLSKLHTLANLALKQFLHSLRCVAAIIKNRDHKVLYLPYPAVPVLCLLSFLPRRAIPQRIVMDSFISLYDTIVLDRSLITKSGIPAKLIHLLERRALATADSVITDTPESSEHIKRLFNLPPEIFCDVPLAINEHVFNTAVMPNTAATNSCRILFVGTLVPLHRIDIILSAISQLAPSRPIDLTFIGDGQQASLLESFLENRNFDESHLTITWIRQWLSSRQVAQHIINADICLGIMGFDGKSGRVWPLKNYLYMACGKILITAKTCVTDRLTAGINYSPFLIVDTTDSSELTSQLQHYIDNPDHYEHIASNAAQFFRQYLSHDVHANKFRKILA